MIVLYRGVFRILLRGGILCDVVQEWENRPQFHVFQRANFLSRVSGDGGILAEERRSGKRQEPLTGTNPW